MNSALMIDWSSVSIAPKEMAKTEPIPVSKTALGLVKRTPTRKAREGGAFHSSRQGSRCAFDDSKVADGL